MLIGDEPAEFVVSTPFNLIDSVSSTGSAAPSALYPIATPIPGVRPAWPGPDVAPQRRLPRRYAVTRRGYPPLRAGAGSPNQTVLASIRSGRELRPRIS